MNCGASTKHIGSVYCVSTGNEIKISVNQWLVQLLVALRRQSEDDHPVWSLILDTEDLITFQTLQKALKSVRANTTVIPNPNQRQYEAMKEKEKMLLAFPISSHTLLHSLTNNNNPIKSTIEGAGFTTFEFVWLDYCGTFASKSGRQRQNDLHLLFQANLLKSNSILCVTFSQRGAPQNYPLDVVDELFLFLRTEATSCSYFVSLIGVVSYENTTIHVQKRRSRQGGAGGKNGSTTMITASFLVQKDRIPTSHIMEVVPTAMEALYYYPGATWIPFQLHTPESDCNVSPLWKATEYIGSLFSKSVLSTIPKTEVCALILDSKLLPVCRALVHEGVTPNVLTIASTHLLSALVSSELISILGWEEMLSIHQETPERILEMKPTITPNIIWLSYTRKTYSAKDIRNCENWTDLNASIWALLNSSANSASQSSPPLPSLPLSSWLGMELCYSSSGELWDCMGIDYILHGVGVIVEKAGFKKEQIVAEHIIRFKSNAPRLIIIFSFSNRNVKCIDMNCGAVEVKSPRITGWQQWKGWDMNRALLPCSATQKFAVLGKYLLFLIEYWKIDHLMLHEPGFLILLPILLSSSSTTLWCHTLGDLLIRKYLNRYKSSSNRLEIVSPLQEKGEIVACHAFFLFSFSGGATWERDWNDVIDHHIGLLLQESEPKPLVVALHFEISNKKNQPVETLLQAVQHRIGSILSLEPFCDVCMYINNCSVQYCFAVLLFLPNTKLHELVTWKATKPILLIRSE